MDNKRKISVIGLGYVGLPVAVAFGKNNHVIGYDISEARITELRSGQDHTNEVDLNDLMVADIVYTTNPDQLMEADFHIVSVPTPIDADKQPNLIPLLKATETVGKILKTDDIVIFESTVYPGCTEEDCIPVLEKASGLKYNDEFFVGYSPERIVPGDKDRTFTKIKKIVSGSTTETLDIVADVYTTVVAAGVYRAKSIAVAEAAKVIENTQRDVNIALINELALIFDRINLDTQSVLEAAGTKWNFHQYSPGLVGGHCIGVDPYYLVNKAGRLGLHTDIISSARRINDGMSVFVAQCVIREMVRAGICVKNTLVTVLGITFKEDCPDIRNSQIPNMILELKSYGIKVQVVDPIANEQECHEKYAIQLHKESSIKPATAIIVAVGHKIFNEWTQKDWKKNLIIGGLVADIKGVVPKEQLENNGISVWRL
jgi:UDP-N-acetyl-D-glucosamine/UDP-N-acetyl-D-galactosamine dehydrogenase